MPRFGRHNKDTYSWELENSNTKHGSGILVNKKWRNVATGQTTSANAPYQRLSQSTNNMYY